MEVYVVNQEIFLAAQAAIQAWDDANRPSILLKLKLYIDGDQWCALFGSDIQDGLAGFGETPNMAMLDFDKNYYSQKAMAC